MEEPRTPDLPGRPWLLVLGLPLLVALTALFKVRDLDVWWRVRTGEWIWNHKSIPETDPFSHTADGLWNCVEPAGNLFLYAFHAAFGQVGLSWAGAVMAFGAGLGVVALARYAVAKGPELAPVVVAVGLFVSVSNYRFGPKPEVFTLCGLAGLLLLLHVVDRTRNIRLLALVPLLVVVWAWLHRGSTVAFPVAGAAAVVWAVHSETRRLAFATAGALAVTLLALEVLPGMSGFLSSSTAVISTSVYTKHIGEWQPLSLKAIWSTMPLLPVLTILWLVSAPVQRRLHFGTLVVLGLGFMAMRHARFVPLVALAMVPEVAWGLARLIEKHGEKIADQVRPSVLTGLLVVGSGCAMLWPYLDRPPATWGPGVHHTLRPAHAAEFLAENPPPGRMFNTFNYGSYLLYRLGPEQKVFIDGRNDQVYTPELFAKAAVTPGNNQVLAELIQSYDIGYAVLQFTMLESRSYLWLYRNPEWRLVYMDDKAAIVVKQTPESQTYLEQHAYHELRPDTATARADGAHLDPRRAEFELEVLRHVAEVPHSIRAHYLAAAIHRNAGRTEAYVEERNRIIELAAERDITVRLP